MISPDAANKLKLAFGSHELAWLRLRLRKRIEREGALGTYLKVATPTMQQRRSIERFLGRPGEFGKHLSIRIDAIQAILSPLGAPDLKSVLETLDGPIISRQQRRAEERATWIALLEDFEIEFSSAGVDSQKLMSLVESGLLKRAAVQPRIGRELLQRILKVQQLLKALSKSREQICRAELAARVLGDSHALDSGTSEMSILKHLCGRNSDDDYTFWKSMLVTIDETSSTVLTLNMRFNDGDLAPALNSFASAGEPCRITLKTIERGLTSENCLIFVCENPAILHAASLRLGTLARPMICTEGQPSFACQKLLAQLCERNIPLCYHGDFDWGGVKIANFLYRQYPSIASWRFKTLDYEGLDGGFALAGEAVDALWDAELRAAMEKRKRGFHEESILTSLLKDLDQSGEKG